MELRVYVPWQALAVPLCVGAVVFACGARAGGALLIVTGAGALLWAGLAAAHAIRTRGEPEIETGERWRALLAGVLGLVLPAAGCAWLAFGAGFGGALFHSEAAVFGGVALVVIPVAILASSFVDRYAILPFCHGQLGPPIWSLRPLPSKRRRQRYAKLWVAHRAICEICCYSALAVLLAIVVVALGGAVAHEHILAVALESLGGTGVAVAILGYVAPRVRDSMNYMLADNAGLGTWAEGIDNTGHRVEGFVVDVAVHPGVKLFSESEKWHFVALRDAERLHEAPGQRPPRCDEAWQRLAVLMREEAKPELPPREYERRELATE